MKLLVLVVLALALSACCSAPSVQPTTRSKPVESMEPCVPLRVPETGTGAELAQGLQDASQLYLSACSDKRSLVDWIQRSDIPAR
mgnify:FL=1